MSSEKNKLARDPKTGRILPGHTLNPGGKVKGIERLMRELVEDQREDWDGKSLDGWEAMTMMMYEVAMGRQPPGMSKEMDIKFKDRAMAAQFLFDRVHGKAKILIESESTVHKSGIDNVNPDLLSREELEALEAHVELLVAKVEGKATDSVIDVNPIDAELVPEVNPDEVP